jgi:2-keto-3-deoxy-L-rhamnonate aldolase RhmA
MPLGIFGVTVEAVAPYLAQGYTLIVAGVDTLFLARAATQMLREVRGE